MKTLCVLFHRWSATPMITVPLLCHCQGKETSWKAATGDAMSQKEINKVHYKKRVLNYFPNTQEQNDGKNVILAFEQGMQQMLKT